MDIMQAISELGKAMGDIAYPIILILSLIGAAIGLVYCFFGYKLIKIGYAITGFVIGLVLGITIATIADASTGLAVVAGLVCGIALGFLLFKLYKVSLFLQVMLIGTIILFVLFESMPAALILSMILGVVAVFMVRPAMILSTALGGALLAGNCVWAIFRVSSFGLTTVTVILLFAAGAYFQWKQSGGKKAMSGDALDMNGTDEKISMAMFQDLGKKLGETSQGAVKKTKELAEAVKLNTKISDEKKKINQQLLELGRLFYENCKSAPTDEYAVFVQAIKESNKKIIEYTEQIDALKATETPQEVTVKAPHCPKCGVAAKADNDFCTSCGSNLGEVKAEELV